VLEYTPQQQDAYDARFASLMALDFPEDKAASLASLTAVTLDQQYASLPYEMASAIGDTDWVPDELVSRMLTRGAMSVVYGDSNSGKTFLAIHLGCAIDRGIPFMGRNVEQGTVLYLASESPASVRTRLRAYQQQNECKLRDFVIVPTPIDLFDGKGDSMRVIELVRDLEASLAVKCELIIGDTLARLSAGANENSGEDMGIVVRHVDLIRQETGAHFLLIHHSGKDAARGARGWSGLRAATDTEIEITADPVTGSHAAEVTKQRDIPGKGDRIGFRLQTVELGMGKWGTPITSCVVIDADAPPKASSKRPSEIAGAITEVLTSRSGGMRKGELADHFDGRYTRSCVYREIKKMVESGRARDVIGIVALVKQ
jgi:putative DNA primase/helicase